MGHPAGGCLGSRGTGVGGDVLSFPGLPLWICVSGCWGDFARSGP